MALYVEGCLESTTPEALVRLVEALDRGESVDSPVDAATMEFFEALGATRGKRGAYRRGASAGAGDALRRAATRASEARRAYGERRAEEDCACFDGRLRAELPEALDRLAGGEAVDCSGVADVDAREAFEHVLEGYGLRRSARDDRRSP